MPVEAEGATPAVDQRGSWLDLALLCLALPVLLWGLGSYGLYEPHEAQYGGGGSEMVQRGDWVTAYINGGVELNKPPLFYWCTATSFYFLSHLGLSPEFVARLPLALISLAGLFIVWNWARQLWGLRAARYAAAMLLVSSGWYVFAHQLLIDELLAVLVLASVYFLWKAVCKPDSFWPWCGYYVMIGLAMLAKALLGVIFPVAVFACYILIRRDWKLLWKCRPLTGFLIVAALVVPWAWLWESRNPGAVYYIVVNEHLKRLIDKREPHDYGGVQVDPLSFLMFFWVWASPWSFMLPQVAVFAGANSGLRPAPRTERDEAVLLIALAVVLPVLFFLLIPSRLIYYSLPAVPPFALLCGGFWSAANDWAGWKRKLAVATFAVAGMATGAAAWFVPPLLKGVRDLEVSPTLLQAIPEEALVIGSVFLACAVFVHLRKERPAVVVLVLLMAGLEVFNVGKFADFDAISSSKKTVQTLVPAVGNDCVWITEGSEEVGAAAGTAFYLRRATGNPAAEVLILDSHDPLRPPPVYPGPPLKFFISPLKLNEYWDSAQPVVYMTDFKRTDWVADPPHLPSRNRTELHVEGSGHRHVFVNPAAAKRLDGKQSPGVSILKE